MSPAPGRPPRRGPDSGGRPPGPRGGPRRHSAGAPRSAPDVEPRDLAARLLASIETRRAFSDKLLAATFREGNYPERTRARVNRLVKGVLRRRGELDALLESRLGPKFGGLPLLMRQILRLGVYQMLDENNIPRPMVVDETVRLARKYGHPGTVGLANAVLRRLAESGDLAQLLPQGDEPAALAVRYSHPEWLVERWLHAFGLERTLKILAANQMERPTFLRPNPFRGGPDALAARLAQEAVSHTRDPATGLFRVDTRYAPPDSPAFSGGLCTIQDPSEWWVTKLCGARPGETWLDMCAAPGGKSTGLAEAMRGEGRVIAADFHLSRLRRARETAVRLGTPSLLFVAMDGRQPAVRGPFQGVLVDAPCSGLGTLARKADARWRKEAEILTTLPVLQRELLDSAAGLLGAGGVLVYSVCSFEPEETVNLIDGFLAAHPEFRLDPPGARVPAAFSAEGWYRVFPGEDDMDGAFAARMIRA